MIEGVKLRRGDRRNRRIVPDGDLDWIGRATQPAGDAISNCEDRVIDTVRAIHFRRRGAGAGRAIAKVPAIKQRVAIGVDAPQATELTVSGVEPLVTLAVASAFGARLWTCRYK